MKYGLSVMAISLPSIICFAAAGAMAFHGRDGWGWFLFVGLLASVSISGSKSGGDSG